MTATLADVERYIREHLPALIVGVDEAGRGCWAGPIIAAAAAVSVNWVPPPELNDSKQVTPKKREAIYKRYADDDNVVIGIGEVSPEEIDRIGIDAAQARAQAEAIRGTFYRLVYPPFVVVDGISAPAIEPPEVLEIMLLPKGDALIPAVSLASVYAKVTRDRIMVEYDREYGQFYPYGWANHKGYGTKEHQTALDRLGPCPIHRRSFRPVAKAAAHHQQPKSAWELLDEDLLDPSV